MTYACHPSHSYVPWSKHGYGLWSSHHSSESLMPHAAHAYILPYSWMTIPQWLHLQLFMIGYKCYKALSNPQWYQWFMLLNPQLRKSSMKSMEIPWKWSHPPAAAPQALSLRSSSAALRHGAKGSSAVRAALKEITSWKLRSRGWTSWTKQNVRRIFVAPMILIEDKLFWWPVAQYLGNSPANLESRLFTNTNKYGSLF